MKIQEKKKHKNIFVVLVMPERLAPIENDNFPKCTIWVTGDLIEKTCSIL